jgi:hypothetical protein
VSYNSHHDGLGTFIRLGFGIGLGLMLFHVFAALVVLVALGTWAVTKTWSKPWRLAGRTLFVLGIMLVLAIVFGLLLANN